MDWPRPVELDLIRRQLGRLAWQRSAGAFSPAEQIEYEELTTREARLLALVC